MGEVYIMRRLFLTGTISTILFLTACGSADEPAEQTADEPATEQAAENNDSSQESQQTGKDTVNKEEPADEATESPAEDSQEDRNSENNPSDNQVTILEKKYDEMTRDGFIESIEAQNDEYTELIVYVSDKFEDINEEGYKSKLEGMGKSIREMTSGILYNKERDTLPLIEFRDKDDNIIAKFENHTRDERMVFEK